MLLKDMCNPLQHEHFFSQLTLIRRIFRSSFHMMLRSFICHPTAQGACTLSDVLAELLLAAAAAAASMSTSP
jgi:hypothetical protein